MFAGFNIEIGENFFDNCDKSYKEYINIGEKHLDGLKVEYAEDLKSYIRDDIIDGTKVQNDWFPQLKADIFISHSHLDGELAQALAGWINETFNLNCFIDSNVWGYAEELLEKLNDKYSNKRINPMGGALYDHESCNKVSQHVNIMLSVALQKMIDKAEAIFLLNTDKSIKIANGYSLNSTYSPWIYSEIICTQIVRNKPLIIYRNYKNLYKPVNESTAEYRMAFMSALTVSYSVSLKHLKKLTVTDVIEWKNKNSTAFYEYPLDCLYNSVYPGEVEKAKSAFSKVNPIDIERVKSFYTGNYQNSEMLINEKLDFMLELNKEQQKCSCSCYCKQGECCCPIYFEEECPCQWENKKSIYD